MTQDEKWLQQWQKVMDFMAENKRRPSKFERIRGTGTIIHYERV